MRRNKKENMWNQVQRFSIRKFLFDVTSALLGTFFLANASMGSLSNRVDETIIVKELSSVRLLNSFFSCWSK